MKPVATLPLNTPFEAPEGSWTLAILPDTQSYIIYCPQVFLRQVEWIAAHHQSHNIRFVLHEGDITETNTPHEWELARQAMGRIARAGIPFGISLGNHDYTPGTRCTLVNDYFPGFPCCEAFGTFQPGRHDNHWQTISTPTGRYLIVALEFAPRDEVLAWANTVVAQHPNHRVVVATHAYLYWDGTRFDYAAKGDTQEYSPTTYIPAEHGTGNDAEAVWQKFVSQHPNIEFVFSGHILGGGAAHLVSTGAGGRPVHQIVANFQKGVMPDRGYGGGGFLRLMQFLPDGKTVQVRTYSPWYDHWLHEPEHHFTLRSQLS